MIVKATLFSLFYTETQLSERGEKYQKGCDYQDSQDYIKVHKSTDLHYIQRCVRFNLLLINLILDRFGHFASTILDTQNYQKVAKYCKS